MKYDVIVIGAGLSGLMAAKTAAENGLKTMVLAKGMGRMHITSGSIDLLGYDPEDDSLVQEDVRSAVERLVRGQSRHPYGRVGVEGIEEAILSFSGLFHREGYHYTGEPGRNITLPTGLGSTRPSYRVPSTMIAGRAILSEPTLLVGFCGFANFFPAYAAAGFKALGGPAVAVRVRSEWVDVRDMTGGDACHAASLALQLDEEGFREKVAERIRAVKRGETLIGLPAVLGLRDAEQVKRDLEGQIGSRVFELPILPPSIPGMRLFDILRHRLRSNGVKMILGFEVASPIVDNGRCRGVILRTPSGEKVHQADAFILATGGLFGGGLEAYQDHVIESVFNLPVAQPKRRQDWFLPELLGREGHPIHKAGIRTNDRLIPVDEEGRVVVQNLFAAGSILADCDPAREKSGTGIAIATGFQAVRNLVEQ